MHESANRVSAVRARVRGLTWETSWGEGTSSGRLSYAGTGPAGKPKRPGGVAAGPRGERRAEPGLAHDPREDEIEDRGQDEAAPERPGERREHLLAWACRADQRVDLGHDQHDREQDERADLAAAGRRLGHRQAARRAHDEEHRDRENRVRPRGAAGPLPAPRLLGERLATPRDLPPPGDDDLLRGPSDTP